MDQPFIHFAELILIISGLCGLSMTVWLLCPVLEFILKWVADTLTAIWFVFKCCFNLYGTIFVHITNTEIKQLNEIIKLLQKENSALKSQIQHIKDTNNELLKAKITIQELTTKLATNKYDEFDLEFDAEGGMKVVKKTDKKGFDLTLGSTLFNN